ncbi:PKD domain-containing protein [Rudanella paleaurantiibacter]|uniref:PKD domain-containing protein n=1 Tax=Rudanella paleaurantiibacter TaxID=2614655 RepID=A0A7J5TV93_9BACT|nr:ThuA domain-containing protein [Rudanella paleaurantiibacter]KAB7728078.1 PKD domain-containing protein [Rudanella paleaurantiibacter]
MFKSFRPWRSALLAGCLMATTASWAQQAAPALNRVLVFSKTKGFRHSSIPAGQRALMKLGQENGFAVDTTEDAGKFTETNLKRYGLVLFLSTTGDVLDDAQQAAFERYIQAGGGYVGIHAATDTEYNWPWYTKLAGGQFASHPGNPNVQTGEAYVVNKEHPSMFGFPERWKIKDEFYDFKNFNKDVNVLVKIDETTYKDGKMGADHPMIWYHEYDGGKAFYTNFGHPDETYTNPVFLQNLLGGMKWAMAKQLKYSAAKTMPYPEENRFNQEVLAEKLDEPTELVVMNSGKVLFTERKGAVKLYNPKTKTTKLVTNLPVHYDREYGLMGVNIDPKFNENKWVYLYYSAVKPDSNNRLVRMKWDDVKDELLLNTEQILLTVTEHRTYDKDDCCHTAGSIAWDRQGNLYLSTGDNTNPFYSNGFSPSDDRPDRKKYNALTSSSNTNDLRGKILRIKPRPEGGYDIPEGNLFPKGTPGARPEIYVMGNRNPYRISVDQRTGFLYWGEVGPDAGENSEKRGPRGHDEINQARKAGYFGWPLFVADNRPYRQYNFADSTSGPANDPAKPINYSRNITGLRELPPAQKAFIYYPYADSPEFGSIVGKGGRNAMGGPVYYYDDFPETAVKFPRHYDGKFFAYDWMRDWINPVTMTKDGDFVKMERFMPGTKFSHPIDMQFANDGSLYVLEYGTRWFAQNDDARLTRITYNAGNRKPVVMASVSKKVGAAPLKVAFDSKGTMDYDGDALKYEWTFGKGLPKSTQANPSFTYAKPGVYQATLKVTDAAGNTTSRNLEIKVGNEEPTVALAVKGNKTFYFENRPVEYEVEVADKEDGTLKGGKISADDVTMTINYLEGFDKTMLAQGHQANTGFSTGRRLIELSDCKSCHAIDKKSIGPAYTEVADKYRKDNTALNKLARKVITGGGGVWGEQAMSAHPQLKEDEAKDMVRYILSLGDSKAVQRQPVKGAYVMAPQKKPGSYVFTASYTDKGNGSVGPLTGSTTVALRSPRLKASQYDGGRNMMKFELPGTKTEVAIGTQSGSHFHFNDIDLTGINALNVAAVAADERLAGGKLEVRLGSETGQLLGSAVVKPGSIGAVSVPLTKAPEGMHKLYFVLVNPDAKQKPLFAVDTVEFIGGSM